ncbi:uncharacterized protein LOC111830903 [Capsella rubella]|uniref:uncharacterized protein LOC111830903 n=1 Tax=Capsella rubella TaxID=81985 RepID=UPI000CD58116|nr:uncharacterized protein LOC111830903 [Capsella rubella]
MSKYRRMKGMEESYGGASGEFPEFGAIFMSNDFTRKECLRRELFGLPMRQAGFVKHVKAGMILFLFEFESRELHGVFQASSDGDINIEPNAFHSSGKQFPAQVKFTEKWRCRPLPESEFRHAILENYFTATKFNFGLSKAQVQRLLKLFSLKKEDGSWLRKTAVVESSLRNRVGGRGFGNRNAGETDEDVDLEFPYRVTSAGDARGRRPTENYGFGDESDIGLEFDPAKRNEYSGETSGVNLNYSFGKNALTNNSLVNDRRVPKNLRHTASGWVENEYNEKDGIAQERLWSNDKEDPAVLPQRIPLDIRYGTNTLYYDPSEPGIMEDATMASSKHNLRSPNVDLNGSASFSANSNYGLVEEYIPVGGYVNDALTFETVQPLPDERNGTSMNTSSLGYIPMPIEHREYQTKLGMSGAVRAEFESGFRNGHLRQNQFPGLSTSAGTTENMKKVESLPYPDHSIFPSFADPSSSRDVSPKDRLNNEIQAYQHQEEFGGHVSYTNNMAVRSSSIYPSFAYPSTTRDGSDLYDRTNIKGQAYQRHEEFGGNAFDSNNRVTQIEERVNPAELGRNRTRESVFKRLGVPSKGRDAKDNISPDTESVDEVMAYLNDCHKHWMEQKRLNMGTSEDSGKPKKKKEKIQTAEVLDNDMMRHFTETTPDDLFDCEGSIEHNVPKLPIINFKRRSEAQKSPGEPTQGCKENPETPASQNKKRKLMRPKLIEDDLGKDRGNKVNPMRIVSASEKDRDNNVDTMLKFLASQSATEVPVHNEDNSISSRGKNEDPIENTLASQSAVEVPVHDFVGCDEDDSEKDRGKDVNPIDNVLAYQSATEVPLP